ncbi:MAG: hypothetical protein ISS31_06585 [Kiritimatiellae bacterium]|nr:hypothetical protein [Kiritimatiellia bacterium]
MKRNALFAPVFVLTLFVLSAAAAVGAYAVRVSAVRRGIERAMERFYEQENEKGFAQLDRIDYWAGQHPAFISQVRCAAIIGHIGTNQDEAAMVLADRELTNDRTPPRPDSVWQALYHVVSEQLDPTWLKAMGGREPDPNIGYRTMQHALQATGDEQRLARLNERIAMLFGETGLAGAAEQPAATVDVEAALEAPDFGRGRFAVASGASIRCYNEEGKHCGDLRPGALVTVTDTHTSNGGEVAVCHQENAGISDPPLLVRTRDLIIWKGDLTELPPDVRSLLAEHGRAASELRQARMRAAERNPHAMNYKKATTKYKAFVAKVKRLTAARDKAEGADRTRYADELHGLKNKAPELRDAYETAKRNYEEWKATNGGSVDSDPEVATIQDRVDKASQQLAPYFDT